MINVGESATLILNIGQEVGYKESSYTIGNLGFRSEDGSFVGALSGKLYYNLLNDEKASIGWIIASDISLPEVKVEVESTDGFFEQDERSPHLEELGHSMVGWLDGLESRPDNENLPAIVTILMAIQYDKEGDYGSSWKGKGEYRGIMANIDRKYDRLDKMTEDELSGLRQSLKALEEDTGVYGLARGYESKIDAIADLTCYGMLYMTFVKSNYPKMFNSWVKNNVPKYLADKIPFI